MNKTWIVIGLGSLIIVGTMVFLTIKGVSRREHTFIKWSQVDEPQTIGLATMKRLFPLLGQNPTVQMTGDQSIVDDIIAGFNQGLKSNNLQNQVVKSAEDTKALSIQVKRLSTTKVKPGSCVDKSRDECLDIKAQRKWHKKERNPKRYWFLLQWVDANSFYLYFTPPNPQG